MFNLTILNLIIVREPEDSNLKMVGLKYQNENTRSCVEGMQNKNHFLGAH